MACSWSAIGPFTVLRVLLVARLVQPYRHIEVNVPHHHSGIAETRTADNRECQPRPFPWRWQAHGTQTLLFKNILVATDDSDLVAKAVEPSASPKRSVRRSPR